MSVSAEERLPGAHLIPPGEKLVRGVAKEAADVRADKGETGNRHGEQHRHRGLQVFPGREIVAGPHRAPLLASSKEASAQDEGPDPVFSRPSKALKCCPVDVVSVRVVQVAMLPAALVLQVLGHGELRAIEDGGLVHVVPGVQVVGEVWVRAVVEQLLPHGADARGQEVQVARVARPAPARKVCLSVLLLHVQVLVLGALVDDVVLCDLNVRVDDRHDLAATGCNVVLHL
mmetsp:Transcript_7042/g.21465  ORF Transcript_7042/g.21465 Transcript_7042/m.21465 type:complete len:230 (-) Transcript_7042:1328-2017(-)